MKKNITSVVYLEKYASFPFNSSKHFLTLKNTQILRYDIHALLIRSRVILDIIIDISIKIFKVNIKTFPYTGNL